MVNVSHDVDRLKELAISYLYQIIQPPSNSSCQNYIVIPSYRHPVLRFDNVDLLTLHD